MVDCKECGNSLHVSPKQKPDVDWVKIVCSECGTIENVSMIRLSATIENK